MVSEATSNGRQETIPFVATAAVAYGLPAALVLCLVRYRCQVPGHDRIESPDGRLWKKSYKVIAENLGLSTYQVQRAVTLLRDRGALDVEYHPARYGDQERALRVVPDPAIWWEDGEPVTSDSAYAQSGCEPVTSDSAYAQSETLRMRSPHSANAQSLPITEEVEEGGEEGGGSGPARKSRRVGTNSPQFEVQELHRRTADASADNSAGTDPVFHFDASGRACCAKHSGWERADIPACGACGTAREAHKARMGDADEQERARVRAEVAAKRALIEACGKCDPWGRVDTDSGLVPCSHEAVA